MALTLYYNTLFPQPYTPGPRAMPLTGIAELPLHDGKVPRWLAEYMRRLTEAFMEAIVALAGPERFVDLVADPLGFQAFNNAIGMDWDSSGSTTVTTAMIKEVAARRPDLGIIVAGGKGALARSVPDEINSYARQGLLDEQSTGQLLYVSRLSAKTDSVLLQDGYSLYHHTLIAVTAPGRLYWAVIQQGMNPATRMARRYHWKGGDRRPQTLEPHTGIIASRTEGSVQLDLTSRRSLEARNVILELVSDTPVGSLVSSIREALGAVRRCRSGTLSLDAWLIGNEGFRTGFTGNDVCRIARYYRPPSRPPRLEPVLRRIKQEQPETLEGLLLINGVGESVIRSLALVAELVHGVTVSHVDPAVVDPFRYAYIVGGKDGVPFPFRRDYAEKVILFLRDVAEEARLGENARRRVLARLEKLAKLLEPR